MKQYYDQNHQTAPEYKVRDKAWLSLQNYSSDCPMKKLDHKWAGPFTITKVISPTAIKLHLSAQEKNIHPVISISSICPYIPDEIAEHLQPLQHGCLVRITKNGSQTELVRNGGVAASAKGCRRVQRGSEDQLRYRQMLPHLHF